MYNDVINNTYAAATPSVIPQRNVQYSPNSELNDMYMIRLIISEARLCQTTP